MAAQQPIQLAEETLHHLNRLSQKPGVQSTLILSRETGAMVRASGLLVSDTHATQPSDNPGSPSKSRDISKEDSAEIDSSTKPNGPNSVPAKTGAGMLDGEDGKLRSAEEVAGSVWRFFGAAGNLVGDIKGDGEDEVKLLRLRMRRCELMVVPDAKYLLVVVHDTPAA